MHERPVQPTLSESPKVPYSLGIILKTVLQEPWLGGDDVPAKRAAADSVSPAHLCPRQDPPQRPSHPAHPADSPESRGLRLRRQGMAQRPVSWITRNIFPVVRTRDDLMTMV